MQSVLRFASGWGSETSADRTFDKASIQKARSSPIPDLSVFKKLKRKATDSPTPEQLPAVDAPAPKKPKVCDSLNLHNGATNTTPLTQSSTAHPHMQDGYFPHVPAIAPTQIQRPTPAATPKVEPSTPAPIMDVPHAKNTVPTRTKATSETLNEIIQSQIDLEILLKHNELRCIEQELAKCQVALEQLRRCRLIPYPGSEGMSVDVSEGVGPALEPGRGLTRPQHPAPWGVTDGPYSRHYAKWLIPDPKFDPTAVGVQTPGIYAGKGLESRSTRGSILESPVNGHRPSRVSTGSKLHALSSDYPVPRDRAGPLIIKRSTDGQFVKLVCNDCERSNFSSAQGFLNHCRIAHHRDFKSHDAAAIACGRPVDVNEAGAMLPPQEQSHSNPTPVSATAFVHPLIKGPLPDKSVSTKNSTLRRNPQPAASSPLYSTSFKPPANAPVATMQAPSTVSSSFKPSATTPHLSALLAKTGFSGDLESMVANAKVKTDLSMLDTSDDDQNEVETPVSAKPKESRAVARMPARPGMSPSPLDRPASRKGVHSPTDSASPTRQRPRALQTAAPQHGRMYFSTLNSSHPSNGAIPETPTSDLSPNTMESNPGLVSDADSMDEDSEYQEDNESEVRGGDVGVNVRDDTDVDMIDAQEADMGKEAEASGARFGRKAGRRV